MIPNAEQLTSHFSDDQGGSRRDPVPRAPARRSRSTSRSVDAGALTGGSSRKEIVLENGVPVDCNSNLLQDTLGKFMVARGRHQRRAESPDVEQERHDR